MTFFIYCCLNKTLLEKCKYTRMLQNRFFFLNVYDPKFFMDKSLSEYVLMKTKAL